MSTTNIIKRVAEARRLLDKAEQDIADALDDDDFTEKEMDDLYEDAKLISQHVARIMKMTNPESL